MKTAFQHGDTAFPSAFPPDTAFPTRTRGWALLPLLLAMACGGGHAMHADYGAAPSQARVSGGALPPPAESPSGSDTYAELEENGFVPASQDAMATFSLDVDTASYTRMRRALRDGALPDPDSVRPEEYINFFRWSEAPARTEGGAPFAVQLEQGPSPFGSERMRLLRVGVQAAAIPASQRPSANLVFLVDVSGSMGSANKIGLVKYALTTLVNTLREDDTVGIVVYAGQVGTLIEPTPVAQRGRLLEAIAGLAAGGSTNGEGGIRAAYDLAAQHHRPGGINRVIIATDGDFNVGLTGDPLIELIERYRDRDITLTALGFGGGNDRDMERLADHGNGSYAFIDNQSEALRVLQRDLGGTLQVVAQDVKVQVEMNPELVERFRLIGYENRVLAHEDFDNDGVDAAEIGSGQFTTAYLEYETRPGVAHDDPRVLASVRVRYQAPGGSESALLEFDAPVNAGAVSIEQTSPEFRFGAAVAEFAEILRGSSHSEGARFSSVLELAGGAGYEGGEDAAEFLTLVETAGRLWQQR